MTASERALWKALRALDLHIRRQAPIGRCVVDFIHHGARLVIEVDSGWHDDPEAQLHDAERDAWLAKQGYRVMRVRDGEAFGNPYPRGRARRGGDSAITPSQPFPIEGKGFYC